MQERGYTFQFIKQCGMDTSSVLKDHAIYTPMLSMYMRRGKDKGLISWITSTSFGDGEGTCDILSMLTRKFLSDYISGNG